jgi:hypothetical protein
MDRAVLDAYGWSDLQVHCEFIPEFEHEEEQDQDGRPRRNKYRYRWLDQIRDEVLARLLQLNRERAVDEGLVVADHSALLANTAVKPDGRKKSKAKSESPDQIAIDLGEA